MIVNRFAAFPKAPTNPKGMETEVKGGAAGSAPVERETTTVDASRANWAACPFSVMSVIAAGAAEEEWLYAMLTDAARVYLLSGNVAAFDLQAKAAAKFFGQVRGLVNNPPSRAWGDPNGGSVDIILRRLGITGVAGTLGEHYDNPRTVTARACIKGAKYVQADDDLSGKPFVWIKENCAVLSETAGTTDEEVCRFHSDGPTTSGNVVTEAFPAETLMVPFAVVVLIQKLAAAGGYAAGIAEEIAGGNSAFRAEAEAAVGAVFPCTAEEARAAAESAEAAGEADRLRKEQAVRDQLSRNAAEESRRNAQREAYAAAVRAWKSGGVPKSPLGVAAALAAAGFFVGGPIGAAAGGVVGLLSGGAASQGAFPVAPAWMGDEEVAAIFESA